MVTGVLSSLPVGLIPNLLFGSLPIHREQDKEFSDLLYSLKGKVYPSGPGVKSSDKTIDISFSAIADHLLENIILNPHAHVGVYIFFKE